MRQLFENGGEPQGVAVNTGLIEEIQGDQLPHGSVGQYSAERRIFDGGSGDGALFGGEGIDQVALFGFRNPPGFLRTVVDGIGPQG